MIHEFSSRIKDPDNFVCSVCAKMKRTALLLVLSFAVCFGQKVNLLRISDEFAKRALTYEAPRLEPNVEYKDFFKNISKNIQSLIHEVVLELFRQTRFQSYMLSNSMLSIVDELQYELQNTNVTELNPHVETILKKLNSRLEQYINLRPGHIGLGRKVHDEIPDPLRVWSFITYHPLNQLFSHLEDTLDLHFANIHALIDSFYKRGWEGARYSMAQLQQEFRDVYLNGYLLHAFRNVVTTVYLNGAKIQAHVNPETWKGFQAYRLRIRTFFEQIKPSNQTSFRQNLRVIG